MNLVDDVRIVTFHIMTGIFCSIDIFVGDGRSGVIVGV